MVSSGHGNTREPHLEGRRWAGRPGCSLGSCLAGAVSPHEASEQAVAAITWREGVQRRERHTRHGFCHFR